VLTHTHTAKMVPEKTLDVPGPGHYTQKKLIRPIQPSSAFADAQGRFNAKVVGKGTMSHVCRL
jgi:hypothetical protein